MAFVKHRHDQMHRGQVPYDQLAEGTPDPGDTPHYQYDGSVAWEPETGESCDLCSLEINLTVSGSHTADRDTAATHDLTLVGPTTLTPDATTVVAGERIDLGTTVRQDGTGGRTLAFGGSITWATADGNPPTMPSAANAVLHIGFMSLDDATTWFGFAASAGSSVGALDDLSDVSSSGEAEGDTPVFTGSEYENRPAGRHYHVVGEPVTFDGSSTIYYLANLAEEETVAAYDKDGDRVSITHDTSELDKVTFGAAPAAGSGFFDYVAALS